MPDIAIVILKILGALAFVLVLGAPLVIEHIQFRLDRKKKQTHKRLRFFLLSILFSAGMTLALALFQGVLDRVKQLRFILWISGKMPQIALAQYTVTVYAVLFVNFALSVLFVLFSRVIRIRLKKRNLSNSEKAESRIATFLKSAERKVLIFFHKDKWFFVGRLLLIICILLTVVYGILFFLYQLPALFVNPLVPYALLKRLLESGYLYPILTLIPLWEAHYFLAGVERIEEENEEILNEEAYITKPSLVSVAEINEACKNRYKEYYKCTLAEISDYEVATSNFDKVTVSIASVVEKDERYPQSESQIYRSCLDKLVKGDNTNSSSHTKNTTGYGTLINGSLFSGFAPYFLRYISIILARGDNVVFVCNDTEHVKRTCEFVESGLTKIQSLFFNENETAELIPSTDLDIPLWRVCCVCEGHNDEKIWAEVDRCCVLVTDLDHLCSSTFLAGHREFAGLIDTVVYVDVDYVLTHWPRKMRFFDKSVMSVRKMFVERALNTKSKNNKHAFNGWFSSSAVRYIFFDNDRLAGVDKVLKNQLSTEIDSADAMNYCNRATITLYDYEGGINEAGQHVLRQSINVADNFGVLTNFANDALSFGAKSVSLFVNDMFPYQEIADSLHAAGERTGNVVKLNENFFLNKSQFDPHDYNVVVAFDTNNNLPVAIRKFSTMMSDKESLVVLFSRPYMLRDYYVDNIDTLWQTEQIMNIPVVTQNDGEAIRDIFARAVSGGIKESELFDIINRTPSLKAQQELLKASDIKAVFIKLSQIASESVFNCKLHEDNLLVSSNFYRFTTDGKYALDRRVSIIGETSKLILDGIVNTNTYATAVVDGTKIVVPVPKDRISQNYIVGQNILLNGNVFRINAMDLNTGVISAGLITEGQNEAPFSYLQDRYYSMIQSEDMKDAMTDSGLKQLGKIEVSEISVKVGYCSVLVETKGYYIINRHVLSANAVSKKNDRIYETYIKNDENVSSQLIRRYGKEWSPNSNGARCLSISIKGKLGEDTRKITLLAAAMMGEILRSVFPSVADCIAVCPVFHPGKDSASFLNEPDTVEVMKRLPKLAYSTEASKESCEEDTDSIDIVIIEDCESDLGVIASLEERGDSVAGFLFKPIRDYLDWYLGKDPEKRSKYLFYGLKEEPKCFDFAGLQKIAEIVAHNEAKRVIDINKDIRSNVCEFCGKTYLAGNTKDLARFKDGRTICRSCRQRIVGPYRRSELRKLRKQAEVFMESVFGITHDERYKFVFEASSHIYHEMKSQNQDLFSADPDAPLLSYIDNSRKVHIESSLPPESISEILVREMTGIWIRTHLPELDSVHSKGLIAEVACQYLYFAHHDTLYRRRVSRYTNESNLKDAAVGYRLINKALEANLGYDNNPFIYLLEDNNEDSSYLKEVPPIAGDIAAIYGKEYRPKVKDRVPLEELKYFYRERLDEKERQTYDAIVSAAESFVIEAGQTELEGDALQMVSLAVQYDHPELFWYYGCNKRDDGMLFIFYRVTEEEAGSLQQKVEAAAAEYLELVTPDMSAYDVALRLHIKMIGDIDYDTIALDKQKKAGGPSKDSIDYLRSICGVFINKSAVCEGYARGMQYLLQRCGVECAEVVGKTTGDDPELHAWNILKVDGDYYYLDTTWDDSSNTNQRVKNRNIGLSYFCVTHNEITRSRNIDACPTKKDMPICTATRANYYVHNDLVLSDYDFTKIEEIAKRVAKSKSGILTVKCKSESVYREVLEKLCVGGKDGWKIVRMVSKINRTLSSDSYTYDRDGRIYTVTLFFKNKKGKENE